MIRSRQLFLQARIELAAELVLIGVARATLPEYPRLQRALRWFTPILAPGYVKLGLVEGDAEPEEEDDDHVDDGEWVGRALDQERRTQRAVDSSRVTLEQKIETLEGSLVSMETRIMAAIRHHKLAEAQTRVSSMR